MSWKYQIEIMDVIFQLEKRAMIISVRLMGVVFVFKFIWLKCVTDWLDSTHYHRQLPYIENTIPKFDACDLFLRLPSYCTCDFGCISTSSMYCIIHQHITDIKADRTVHFTFLNGMYGRAGFPYWLYIPFIYYAIRGNKFKKFGLHRSTQIILLSICTHTDNFYEDIDN